MKIKYSIIILLFALTTVTAKAQISETTYLGNVVAEGYHDDWSFGPFNIGFSFAFFGNPYTQFYVTSNGLVMFGSGSGDYTEDDIPNVNSPNNYIAAFWDDIVIDAAGKILYTTIGASPNRKCIIQWTNMGFWSSTVLMGTFTVILYEGSNNIQIQYRSIIDNTSARAHGGDATIGLENSTGTAGVKYSYHNPTAIQSEQAILFTSSGSTYTYNSSAIYDGVYLTKNISLPEPGIPILVTPSNGAVIGTSQTFQWTSSTNASSYTLKISSNSDISSSTDHNTGTNTTYDVTGLSMNATYYWAVFASNSTGITWSEIYRFSTSLNPPLTPVPQTVYIEQNEERTIRLQYTGGDESSKTARITSLPAEGALYQYNSGAHGSQITSVPTTITDADMNVIYVADGATGNGVGNFSFIVSDNTGDSSTGTITVNVNAPGIPNFILAAKSGNIEVQFDKPMADPSGKEGQFTVKVNGVIVSISSVSLKEGDPYTIVVSLVTPLTGTETVLISYTQGDVSSEAGGMLSSFVDQPVNFNIQTITFAALSVMTFGDSPITLTATSSSGLSVTFTSSNTSVATISGTTLTANTPGTSDITAYQGGNGTYAPARYIRSLAVVKADQTITFPAIDDKTYGEADFAPGATASSGLAVTYSSGNIDVATIVAGNIHITGAGSAVITASQAGNALYNAEGDVTITLNVLKADQTITFNALPSMIVGDADFSPGATASSGLTVTYFSDNTNVAIIVGNLIHIVAAGSAVITSSQAGDDNYNAAIDVQRTLTVIRAGQTITFNTLSSAAYGEGDFDPGATASSGLTVTYSSDNSDVATIVGSLIHIAGAGIAAITASQVGDDNYNAASDVQQTLTVNKASQTISFSALPEYVFGDTDFELSATASSGLRVSFTSSNSDVASVSGTTVHITGGGTVIITASQTGDDNYLTAPAIQQTLVINKASQTITFTPLPSAVYGDTDIDPEATASSGLTVTYISSNENVAEIITGLIHITGAGSVEITASQAGDGNYNAATDVTLTLIVGKSDQAITFPALTYFTYGDPSFNPGAIASSGLAITYSCNDPGIVSISGDMIDINGAGTVIITASQSGDDNYNAAVDVTQSVTINKAAQSVTFGELADVIYGDPDFELTATSSSELQIAFSSSNSDVATISGDIIHITGTGSTIITASQSGDDNFLPSPDVNQTLVVNKADQTITFNPFGTHTFGDPDVDPEATASSGLVVYYNSDNTNVAIVAGSYIKVVGAGTAIVTASQAGNRNYNAATDITQVLTVGKADQVITFNGIEPVVYGTAAFDPGATASSSLVVTYSSDNTLVAEEMNGLIKIRGTGEAVITASQAGDDNFNPAADASITLTVTKALLSVTADNKAKNYLTANPELTFTFSGFVYGENESVLDELPVVSTEVDQNSPAGQYDITVSGGSDNCYEYVYISGNLTINKISQLVTFTSSPEELLVNETFTLQAVASSGLPVYFESITTQYATVTGSIMQGVSRGTAVIRVYQPGDENFGLAEAIISVEIISTHSNIMNLFSPNGDGFNDYWEIPDIESYGKCSVKVYSRWGKVVFSSSNYENDWDGTSNGFDLPSAAYYYIIKTENAGTITGTVNIVR
jgi:gliding motility-associated-like protein